jgi:hypothetical protein
MCLIGCMYDKSFVIHAHGVYDVMTAAPSGSTGWGTASVMHEYFNQ